MSLYKEISENEKINLLIFKLNRVRCRHKISECQKVYLLQILNEKYSAEDFEKITKQLDKIYLKLYDEYSNETNEKTIEKYHWEEKNEIFSL